jgi:peptidoglycan/LPS O-acetylase OafA/YrhL
MQKNGPSGTIGKAEFGGSGIFPQRVSGRIPSLDGMRAVAILMVIMGHLAGGVYILPGLGTGHFPMRFTLGGLGVRIFFVISGLLITTLLLQEQERSGRISLRQFYWRRALRILPASYTFLIVLAVAAGLGIVAIPKESFLASFLYFRNYVGGDWYTGHLWSLSVEEQFYLIWPAVLVLLGKRGAVIAAFCALPIANITRVFFAGEGFEKNMDALACGCILACLWGVLAKNERWQRFLRSPLFWAVPLAIVASNKLLFVGGFWLAIGTGVANVLIAVAVERFVRYPTGLASGILNSRAFILIGTLSYSLYLWQEPWLVAMGGHGLFQSFPVNVGMAVCCAALSYILIERPFLRLKDRRKTAQ